VAKWAKEKMDSNSSQTPFDPHSLREMKAIVERKKIVFALSCHSPLYGALFLGVE
jgi:hypothetical protein